jgi:hypothetical protein
MNEPMQVPDEFRPIEPDTPEAARQTAQPAESAPTERFEPFSATHDRPPLPR